MAGQQSEANGRDTYTTTLYVMVEKVKGGGRAPPPPPSPGWADFSIMMEYTKRQKVDIATLCVLFACMTPCQLYRNKKCVDASIITKKHFTNFFYFLMFCLSVSSVSSV